MRIRPGVVALVLVALAGCGGSSGGGGGGGSYGTSADDVASHFKAKTGVTLHTLDDDEVETTFIPAPDDTAAREKYGEFTIYVFKQKGYEDTLLNGAEPADASGVAWKKAGGGYYLGTKRYGTNVYLVFTPDTPGKSFGQKFQLLDAALIGL